MSNFKKSLYQYKDYYDMLSDRVRMEAFEKAIALRVKKGDVVVDLGAGTGILSFLAIKAGAKKVYLIEKSDSIELAKAIAHRNGMTEKIVFLQENSKDVTLDEKVDVILSETLGSFGIDEGTLDFTMDARDRFLKEDGILIPEAIELYLVPIESKEIYKQLDFWNSVSGIDFSPARESFSSKLMIEHVREKDWLSTPALYADLDFYKYNVSVFNYTVTFEINRAAQIHGFGGWFRLKVSEDNYILTAGNQPRTHWKQAYFPIQNPISVIKGDYCELTMEVSSQSENSDNTNVEYEYRCTQLANEK